MAEAPRVGPFSRIYGPWLKAIAASKPRGAQVLVLLCLCERLRFDQDGNATACYPRRELAEALGVPEGTVKSATRRLIEIGLLSVTEPGHNGRATVYAVIPGIPWPEKRRK